MGVRELHTEADDVADAPTTAWEDPKSGKLHVHESIKLDPDSGRAIDPTPEDNAKAYAEAEHAEHGRRRR